VGRPNVGKSSLFNRILGKRAAVVDDIPGVTRDRNYRPVSWQGHDLMIVDTGGMIPSDKGALTKAVHEQIRIAVRESSVVLFVVEYGVGITSEDLAIARDMKKEAADKILLVVNKTESTRVRYDIDEYRSLGLGDPLPVSALHGYGVAEVLDNIVTIIEAKKEEAPLEPISFEQPLRIAVVGRPNAGKSSIVNKLLQKNRMIVDDIAGTTRDSIDSEMTYKDRPVILIDTAGLRKKSHVKQDIEYYFNLRTIKSIERCDICVVVVDASEGIGTQDLRIVSKALDLRKGILLAWNKWDLVQKDHKTFDQLVAQTRGDYLELRQVPMVSISALSGQRVSMIIDRAIAIKERMSTRVPTAEFENNVFTWIRIHPHPSLPKNPVRFLGARQVPGEFPYFRFFTVNPREVTTGYTRFLTNKIYETYDFKGCPIVLEFKPVKRELIHAKSSDKKNKKLFEEVE
jgi:GTP-binding protein